MKRPSWFSERFQIVLLLIGIIVVMALLYQPIRALWRWYLGI